MPTTFTPIWTTVAFAALALYKNDPEKYRKNILRAAEWLAGIQCKNEGFASIDVVEYLSWGSAAALNPKLVAGSLIIQEKIIPKKGKILTANTCLRNSILQQLDSKTKVHSRPLYGSAALLSSLIQKEALFQKTGAIAADMKSAGLAKLAKKHRLPFVALRAIADTVQMRLPSAIANSFNAEGGLDFFKFTIQLIQTRLIGEEFSSWKLDSKKHKKVCLSLLAN